MLGYMPFFVLGTGSFQGGPKRFIFCTLEIDCQTLIS